MAGAVLHYKSGPATYTAAALILGGQLVRPAISGDTPPAGLTGVGVVVCGAASFSCVGVAGADGNTSMFSNYDPLYGPNSGASLPGGWPGDGNLTTQDQLLDQSILGYSIPVYNNVDIFVTYAANAAFGVLLKTAAAGAVTPWVNGTDTDASLIVGRCTQPGGVLANASGRAFIRV